MDRRQRTGYLVLAVVLAHVILISAQVNAEPGATVLETVTFGAFTEVQRLLTSARDGVVGLWSGYVGLQDVQEENIELSREIADLRLELQEQRALAQQTRSLERLLELRQTVALPTLSARVIATDASPAMLALARDAVPGAEDVRRLTLPDDPLPTADAVVSVGHVLSYLPDVRSVERGFRDLAAALRPGGVLAVDLLDRSFRAARAGRGPAAAVRGEWAVFATVEFPDPATCVRDIATFVRGADGAWRRDDERHVNVLVDAAGVAALLAGEGLDVEVARGFDERQRLEEGLVAISGVRRRPPAPGRGFEAAGVPDPARRR